MDRNERDKERSKIWRDWFHRLSSDKEELRRQFEKAGFFEPLNEEEEDE